MHILKQIRAILSQKPSYSKVMVWAMCCLAFFGFLWVSEFTIPSGASYDSTCHLSMKDVAIDRRDNPRLLQVAIKQFKTDPFRRGIDIYLGATDTTICPVKAISAYLALRGGQAGPLFDGTGLTRQAFSSALDSLLSKLKLNHKHYNTHSFWIRVATSTLPLKFGYQTARLKCWDAGRVMPTNSKSKPECLIEIFQKWSL